MVILNTPDHKQIVSWSPDGKSFLFHDRKAFETVVLPGTFKDSKFDSFLRKVSHNAIRVVPPLMMVLTTGTILHVFYNGFLTFFFVCVCVCVCSFTAGAFPNVKYTVK